MTPTLFTTSPDQFKLNFRQPSRGIAPVKRRTDHGACHMSPLDACGQVRRLGGGWKWGGGDEE